MRDLAFVKVENRELTHETSHGHVNYRLCKSGGAWHLYREVTGPARQLLQWEIVNTTPKGEGYFPVAKTLRSAKINASLFLIWGANHHDPRWINED